MVLEFLLGQAGDLLDDHRGLLLGGSAFLQLGDVALVGGDPLADQVALALPTLDLRLDVFQVHKSASSCSMPRSCLA